MHVLWLILLSWYVATPGPVIISLDIHGCNTAAAAGGRGQISEGMQVRVAQPAWPASNTHLSNGDTEHTPQGEQQADHSLAAEIGGIQMDVWCREKENTAGRSEGHMPA